MNNTGYIVPPIHASVTVMLTGRVSTCYFSLYHTLTRIARQPLFKNVYDAIFSSIQVVKKSIKCNRAMPIVVSLWEKTLFNKLVDVKNFSCGEKAARLSERCHLLLIGNLVNKFKT